MIKRLKLLNFKSIKEQTYEFTNFDLLVGRNNSGKSTILQALSIWQFCIDEFHRARRSGSSGIRVVLPNFSVLPVPEFNLLWKDRTDRRYPVKDGKSVQEYILIEIEVTWVTDRLEEYSFGVKLRYESPQTLYAIPKEGWNVLHDYDEKKLFRPIAYVPPFSGLEPSEEWRSDGILRKQVGKAQPGSVLRNLLLRVCPPPEKDEKGRVKKDYKPSADWEEIKSVIHHWFSVKLQEPEYELSTGTQIDCEYVQSGKFYDIIAGGSGFHQVLTLLAFLYGYNPSSILLDEPDAHLHVNLQREILDYFKRKAGERNVQFLIATHAEEFVKGVDTSQIVSLVSQVPRRIVATPDILRAMADISNAELTQLWVSAIILYVEGESDERILRAWAKTCEADGLLEKVYFKAMGGGDKKLMKEFADNHFASLKQIVVNAKRLMLLDFDDADAYHPLPNNPVLYEWKRKNIENYLLVPDAWVRAACKQIDVDFGTFLAEPFKRIITDFFESENLTLPRGRTWRDVTANIFANVDGKRILFENKNSLFQSLRGSRPSIELIRENIAMNMTAEEIHEDVHGFFYKLKRILAT